MNHSEQKVRRCSVWLSQMVFLITLFASSSVGASVFSQTPIDLEVKDMPMREVFKQIERQSNLRFFYNDDFSDLNKLVTVEMKNKTVSEILDKLLANSNVTYKIIGNVVVITPADDKTTGLNFLQKPANVTVNGRVTEADTGEPLIGVTVVEEGTTNGTITDENGDYTLSVSDGATLSFSFVGFKNQEVSVGTQTRIDVALETEVTSLQELVVVGYGTEKKVNLTGSVSTMDQNEIGKLGVTQTSQMLSGQISGLTSIQSSGQPGKDNAEIRIRGMGTFSGAGNSPLILVDGLSSSLDNVDPSDIASVSVLKDAASASIYGARGANGVILIETKKGGDGKVRVNYSGSVGLERPAEIPNIVDSWTYAEMENEALVNDGGSPIWTDADIAKFKSGEDPDNYPNKRHYDDLISSGSGVETNHHISIQGGTKENSYMVSFGYLNQQGLIAETYFKRYNIRANMQNKISKKLTFNLSLAGRLANQNEPTAVDKNPALGDEGLIDYAIKIPNTIAGKMSNGYYGNQTGFTVEGWMDSESFLSNDYKDILTNASLDWDIAKSLKLTARQGYEYNMVTYELYRPLFVVDQFITQGPSELRERNTQSHLSTQQVLLNYDLPLEGNHFHFLAGFSQEAYRTDYLEGFRDNFPNNLLYELNAASQSNQQAFGSAAEWALRSVFGRITYNYQEKYLFEADGRYDGSSRFPTDNRYGFFPSVSAAWRISEEPFFQISSIDELKLRASWGKLGNQNIGDYPYQEVFALGLNAPFGESEVMYPGTASTTVANRDISWESTRVSDAGIDVSMLGGKVDVSVDYFNKLTSGILYNITASKVLGLTPSVQNAGEVSNRGFEIGAQHRNKIGQVTYTVGGNFSYVKNTVEKLANVEKDIANGLFVGYPLQSIYGYETDGLFVDQADIDSHASQPKPPQPGTIKFRDISGPNGVPDGIVDADYDRKVIGSEFPKFNYGLNLGAMYKGFDFSVQMRGVGGVDKIITGYQGNAFLHGSNPQQWMYDSRWTVENPDPHAAYPRLSILGEDEDQFYPSTFIMKNAAFLRVNNVQIGYKFPKGLVDRLHMTDFRVYASVRNLITFDHFRQGWDPELGEGYPPVRVFNLGVNLNF